ncbi:hypothetical protein Tco_0303410 [Tanacetum coccineum]
MTRSTARKFFEPLDEPEREIHWRRKAARRHQQNESLIVGGRNLFDDVASSSGNTKPKIVSVPKSLHEHSRPNPSGFQNPIVFQEEQTGDIVDARDIWLIQNVCEFQGLETENPFDHLKLFLSILDNIQADKATKNTSRLRFFHFTRKGEAKKWLDRDAWRRFQDLLCQAPHHGIKKWFSLNEDEGCDRIEELVRYQDNSWDNPSSNENVSFVSEMTKPTLDDRIERAHQQLSFLTTSTKKNFEKPIPRLRNLWRSSRG